MKKEQIDQFVNGFDIEKNVTLHRLERQEDQDLIMSYPGKHIGYTFFKIDFSLKDDGTIDAKSIKTDPIEDILLYCEQKNIDTIENIDLPKVLHKVGKNANDE